MNLYGLTLKNGLEISIKSKLTMYELILAISNNVMVNFDSASTWSISGTNNKPVEFDQIAVHTDQIIAISHKEVLE